MFDWKLFQDDKLIEEYLNIKVDKNIFFITNEFYFNNDICCLTRKNDDYSFDINFNKKELTIKLHNNNYEGKIKLVNSTMDKKEDFIRITYQIDKDDPINVIEISKREG